jgi:hypothetical protein
LSFFKRENCTVKMLWIGCLLCSASFAIAEDPPPPLHWNTVGHFEEARRSKSGDDTMKVYLAGIGDAFLLANVELESAKVSPLFCQPPALALNADNYLAILESSMKEKGLPNGSANDELPVVVVLLSGLKKTFPCAHAH